MTNVIPIYLDRIASAKSNLSSEQWTAKPAPEKWSKQEILGHLTDSAIHNVKRFYDIKHEVNDYQVIPYSQDDLVRLRKYNEMSLDAIIDSLKNLNLEIHNCASHYTSQDLTKTVIDPYGNKHTVEWFVQDYVAHLEHHLKQIFGEDIVA